MLSRVLVLAAALSLLSASCGTIEVDIERFPSATPPASAPAVSPVVPSSTAVPSLPPPTLPSRLVATATVAAVSTPAATRIQFPGGTTQSTTRGSLQPGRDTFLVMKALKGQVLVASLVTPNHDGSLAVTGADGNIVPHLNPGTARAFMAVLPETQDYYFRIIPGSTAETFTLYITVAVRVQFEPGGKQAVLSGRTVNGLPVTYSADAKKGQQMHVTLEAPQGTAALSIWGLSDDNRYLEAQSGSRDFGLVLPADQQYMIEVVPLAGQEIDYIIAVQIE